MKRTGSVLLAFLALGLLWSCSDSTAPEPSGATVTGIVVDEYLSPKGSVMIHIPGADTAVTGNDGLFSIDGVEAPYDLITTLHWNPGVLVYHGITGRDLQVKIPLDAWSRWPQTAFFRGSLDAWFHGADEVGTSVLFDSPVTSAAGDGTRYSYTAAIGWNGPDSTTGALHALQWRVQPETGAPDEFRYGRLDLTVRAGESQYYADVDLDPVGSGSIAGTVRAPDGYSVARKALSAGFRPGRHPTTRWPIGPDLGSGTDFRFPTPDFPDATFTVTARAVAGEAYSEAVRTGLASAQEDVELILPPAPVLHAPAEGASIDGSTRFAWSGTEGAVYLFSLRYVGPADRIPPPPDIYILTTDTTAFIPDLAPLNITFRRNSPYRWEVRAYAPMSSVDAVMGAEHWFVPDADGTLGASAPRQLTYP